MTPKDNIQQLMTLLLLQKSVWTIPALQKFLQKKNLTKDGQAAGKLLTVTPINFSIQTARFIIRK